ncbi:MAG: hypothetical protein AB8G15_03555 [Saprospiraceae bacterium]
MSQFSYKPSITLWNRLEGRPRTVNFDRAIKAEVRDALWMLTKQWQMGEFKGDDAGSPVFSKVHLATTALTKYQAKNGPVDNFEQDIPLEAKVERQNIPFQNATQKVAFDIRLLMGRQWLKMLAKIDNDPSLKQTYLSKYAIVASQADQAQDAQICAEPKEWQQFAAIAGRAMDGYDFYQFLKADPLQQAATDIPVAADKIAAVNTAGEKFIAWYEKLFYQTPTIENPAWDPAYLEHQFACSAPEQGGEKVLVAEEYYQGHLDWYNLDIDDERANLAAPPMATPAVEATKTLSFLPTTISFAGMPHTRWWTFEDWKTDLGNIDPDTTDLNKLLLLDFGLVYANDWFLVPFTLPAGSLATVKGLSVTNVFGERIWVDAAGKGDDQDWERWSMFNLNVRGDLSTPADLSLVVLPSVPKILESQPREEVFLLRDEVANMVWGVEATVTLPSGKTKPGKEAAYAYRNKLQQLLDALPPVPAPPLLDNNATIRYQLMNAVPENWIPFVPIHLDDNNREIQLQRASLPRFLNNDLQPPKKIEPRTSILRTGLDEAVPVPYFLHEEEVSRSGTSVYNSFQRTRWYDGKVYTWLGMRKRTGKGEGSSGLRFDQVLGVEE